MPFKLRIVRLLLLLLLFVAALSYFLETRVFAGDVCPASAEAIAAMRASGCSAVQRESDGLWYVRVWARFDDSSVTDLYSVRDNRKAALGDCQKWLSCVAKKRKKIRVHPRSSRR